MHKHNEQKLNSQEMEEIVLKKGVLNKIKSDPMLYGKVASALRVSPSSMPRILMDNGSKKLTQASVLVVIREHLNVKQDKEILENK